MDERPSERMSEEPDGGHGAPDGDADLLTIGLVVFFVALVLTVVALLVAPTLL